MTDSRWRSSPISNALSRLGLIIAEKLVLTSCRNGRQLSYIDSRLLIHRRESQESSTPTFAFHLPRILTMDGRNDVDQAHAHTRPYRSKRHRPCDVCRRRKHACFLEDQPPCRVCRVLGTECTFNEPPSKRRRQDSTLLPPIASPSSPSGGLVPPAQHTENDITTNNESLLWTEDGDNSHEGISESFDAAEGALDPLLFSSSHDIWYATTSMFNADFSTLTNDGTGYARSGNPQTPVHTASLNGISNSGMNTTRNEPRQVEDVHSTLDEQPPHPPALDVFDGQNTFTHVQYLGPSSDIDPYLMKYMRFPDNDACNFGPFRYLQISTPSGLTNDNPQVPTYFIQSTTNDILRNRESESETLKEELAKLISPEVGVRLLGLLVSESLPLMIHLTRSI